MEPEGSLLCSQQPAIGPYPEPDKSTTSHPTSPRFVLIFSLIYAQAFQVVPSLLVFQPKFCIHCSYPHACYMPVHFIFLDLISLNEVKYSQRVATFVNNRVMTMKCGF
jgi:hypothetical protein